MSAIPGEPAGTTVIAAKTNEDVWIGTADRWKNSKCETFLRLRWQVQQMLAKTIANPSLIVLSHRCKRPNGFSIAF